jgi:hypothetical protein
VAGRSQGIALSFLSWSLRRLLELAVLRFRSEREKRNGDSRVAASAAGAGAAGGSSAADAGGHGGVSGVQPRAATASVEEVVAGDTADGLHARVRVPDRVASCVVCVTAGSFDRQPSSIAGHSNLYFRHPHAPRVPTCRVARLRDADSLFSFTRARARVPNHAASCGPVIAGSVDHELSLTGAHSNLDFGHPQVRGRRRGPLRRGRRRRRRQEAGTRSDGVLVGVLRREDAERALESSSSA